MNKKSIVEPIRDFDKIIEIKTHLLQNGKYRDWLMFSLGLNLAIRISDLLKQKISDLYDSDMYPKNKLVIRKKKTNKENVLAITNGSRETFLQYQKLVNLNYSDNYIFKFRQGRGNPIDRVQAYRIINKAVNYYIPYISTFLPFQNHHIHHLE